jgi:hypothetical protein
MLHCTLTTKRSYRGPGDALLEPSRQAPGRDRPDLSDASVMTRKTGLCKEDLDRQAPGRDRPDLWDRTQNPYATGEVPVPPHRRSGGGKCLGPAARLGIIVTIVTPGSRGRDRETVYQIASHRHYRYLGAWGRNLINCPKLSEKDLRVVGALQQNRGDW